MPKATCSFSYVLRRARVLRSMIMAPASKKKHTGICSYSSYGQRHCMVQPRSASECHYTSTSRLYSNVLCTVTRVAHVTPRRPTFRAQYMRANPMARMFFFPFIFPVFAHCFRLADPTRNIDRKRCGIRLQSTNMQQ